MKQIAVMIATLSLVTTSWAQGDRTENGGKPMQTANDISMVAPALQKYAQGPLAELWKTSGAHAAGSQHRDHRRPDRA